MIVSILLEVEDGTDLDDLSCILELDICIPIISATEVPKQGDVQEIQRKKWREQKRKQRAKNKGHTPRTRAKAVALWDKIASAKVRLSNAKSPEAEAEILEEILDLQRQKRKLIPVRKPSK